MTQSADTANAASSPPQDSLHLTDFLDLPTLQEIQDAFASIANVKARITDADGRLLTQPTPTKDFLSRKLAIEQSEAKLDGSTEPSAAGTAPSDGPSREGREYVAPIVVNNFRLGTIRMTPGSAAAHLDETRLHALAEKLGIDAKTLKATASQLTRSRETRVAAIQFLYILANAVARLCYQEYQLRQRVNELSALNTVTMMLADARDLQTVLDRTVRVVVDIMDCKAASLRLIDAEKDELVIKAAHNLSASYVNKGRISLSRSGIDHVALGPKGYEYVRRMTEDPRVQYKRESAREGVVSMLSVGMRYKGEAVGVLRVYTEKEQIFPPLKIDLLKSIAAQAAAAIENTRLNVEALEAERLEKQIAMAADVQLRMMPHDPPKLPQVDFAAVYVPCYELGGDFYDFIDLPLSNTGLVVADVSGKGVAASLIMAAVRSALRAQVDNVFYLYEVLRRVNRMVCRDTRPAEFVTLFYGVLDAVNLRLTYCNAGHPPPMILRDGKVLELASLNMVLGLNPDEEFVQASFELHPDDIVLLYTDGLTDAMNFQDQTFGKVRLKEAFQRVSVGVDSAETVSQALLWEVRKFAGIAKRTDDITMIVVKVRSLPGPLAKPERK